MFIKAELDLKNKSTANVLTIVITNRKLLGQVFITYFPILKNLGGFGARMGELLPLPISGQITLDNSPGSLETERRFIDLLERFAIVEQPVRIYVANVPDADPDPATDWVLVYAGTIISWETRDNGNDIVLTTSTNTFERRTLLRQIDRSEAIFSNAPQSSVGAYLPVVFGTKRQVKAFRIETASSVLDQKSTAKFAYASTFSNKFVNQGVQTYFARDFFGNYVEVESVSNEDTAFETRSSVNALSFATNSLTELAQLEDFGSGRVLVGIEIRARGTSNATWEANEGVWGVRIYQDSGSRKSLGPLIAESSRTKRQDEALFRSSSSDWVMFQFNRPIVTQQGKSYWLSVFQTYDSPTGDEGDAIRIGMGATLSSPVIPELRKKISRDNYRFRFGNEALAFRAYGVKFTDSPSPSAPYINDGAVGVSYITATMTATRGDEVYADTIYDTKEVINNLDLIVAINGIRDDSLGTITGTASTLLDKPHWVIQCLSYNPSGTTWVPGPIDASRFSSRNAAIFGGTAPYRRLVGGSFVNRVTVDQAIAEVCRNTACRIAFFNGASKQLAVWAWGQQSAAVALITETDTVSFDIEQRNNEASMTRIEINYDRALVDSTTEQPSQDRPNELYLSRLDFSPHVNVEAAALSSLENVYGKTPARTTDFPFIADLSTAINVGRFYLETLSEPAIYVTVEVPFYKYSNVELMDVINIHHTLLPAFFGSAPELRASFYDYEIVEAIPGYPTRRAQMYAAQVESKRINFDSRGAVTITFEARLLRNPRTDLN